MANNVCKTGFNDGGTLIEVIWGAGLIPCLQSPPGMAKSALAHHMGYQFDLPMYQSTADTGDGALIDLPFGLMAVEDVIGLPIPSSLAGDKPISKYAPPEWVVRGAEHGCIIFFDEVDRAQEQSVGGVCAGLAQTPQVIGGRVMHEDTRLIFAINGDTDSGTFELPEAIRQRVVFLYMDTAGDWIPHFSEKHGLHMNFSQTLAQLENSVSLPWDPVDLAGQSSRFLRSLDRMMSLMTSLSAFVIDGDVLDSDAEKLAMRLGHGQLGVALWAKTSRMFMAKFLLMRHGIDENEVYTDPVNAPLPPEGFGWAVGDALAVCLGIDKDKLPAGWLNRLCDEDKQSMARDFGIDISDLGISEDDVDDVSDVDTAPIF